MTKRRDRAAHKEIPSAAEERVLKRTYTSGEARTFPAAAAP